MYSFLQDVNFHKVPGGPVTSTHQIRALSWSNDKPVYYLTNHVGAVPPEHLSLAQQQPELTVHSRTLRGKTGLGVKLNGLWLPVFGYCERTVLAEAKALLDKVGYQPESNK
ncbi:hypothetical protein [Bowmanella denitrificans]|uniref:hypothetical protein n=1 Tax=Bowmanella denitrificans TaxID=366582 RepID=UPI000C9A7C30|nr:hypothetical protein [Bowmanella denitrificans]